MRPILALALVLLIGGCGDAETSGESHGTSAAGAEAGLSAYFSPQTDCRRLIVNHIKLAQKSISVQAYSFTSDTIARALVDAHKRGVKVTIILDAEKAERPSKTEGDYLAKRGVDVFIDPKHEKAHSKIIIVDDETVVTGSFNFAEESEEQVADNILVITGKPKIAAAYVENFQRHLAHSTRM